MPVSVESGIVSALVIIVCYDDASVVVTEISCTHCLFGYSNLRIQIVRVFHGFLQKLLSNSFLLLMRQNMNNTHKI